MKSTESAFNALFALSEIYLRQNKLSDAEKVLVKGLAIQDQSYLGHLNLARVYWEKARETKELAQAKPALEKSYEEVKRALTLNPELAGAHCSKAISYYVSAARQTRSPNSTNTFGLNLTAPSPPKHVHRGQDQQPKDTKEFELRDHEGQ